MGWWKNRDDKSDKRHKHEAASSVGRFSLFGGDLRLGLVLAACLWLKFGAILSPAPKTAVAKAADTKKAADASFANALSSVFPTGYAPEAPAAKKRVPTGETTMDALLAAPPPPGGALEHAVAETKPAQKSETKSEPAAPLLDWPLPPILSADLKTKSAAEPPAAVPASTKVAAPELAPPPETKPAAAATNAPRGPIHPYFQRFLDEKKYYVRAGDTFELIARRLYQDESKGTEIAAANRERVKSAGDLKPGVVLDLP